MYLEVVYIGKGHYSTKALDDWGIKQGSCVMKATTALCRQQHIKVFIKFEVPPGKCSKLQPAALVVSGT
jgi:hypothetical protein